LHVKLVKLKGADMIKFRDASIRKDFSLAVRGGECVLVGANDYQLADKNTPIAASKDVSDNFISGYIDMGETHALFNYNSNLMSYAVDLIEDLDSKSIKKVDIFLPKDSNVVQFNKRSKRTFEYKIGRIEQALKAKSIPFSVNPSDVRGCSLVKAEAKKSSTLRNLMLVA